MINVTKRNGKKEPLDVGKIHKVVEWACEGLTGVSVSEIEISAQLQFFPGIKSSAIHETLIKAASELISEDTPNYQYVAGRLVNYQLRKSVYGKFQPDFFHDHYLNVLKLGHYDSALKDLYSEAEWKELGEYIDHNRDFDIVFAGMEQLRSKYLVKNRTTGQIFETPQVAFMLIAMTLFSSYKNDRIKWVKDLYDALSTFDISLPTPIMAGVRTPLRQFSSCVLIDSDDSLDSINAAASAIVKYVSQKAGIGINGGAIRAEKSPVRNGDTSHTGLPPFWRYWQSATASCSQGSVRKGSATINWPVWHKDFEELIVLKNNKGTEENRVRHMDYCVQFNKVMYERLIAGGNITLFSPHEVPEVYDAFYSSDIERFRTLYETAEKNPKLNKRVMPAKDVFSAFITERSDTHRIYLSNIDHVNGHSSLLEELAPIKMTNLCVEVNEYTKPLKGIDCEEGRIALCTLGAINWGKIKRPKDFQKPCELVVRALDALLDYQEYPVKAAKLHTMEYRPLGVGIINLAYWLAKNGTNYQNPDLNLIHEFAEAWSYYLIEASVKLAEEFGPALLHNRSKYSQGIFPIDTYKNDVDSLVSPDYKMDWGALRERVIKSGIRNCHLMAGMPAETSAQVSNSTNGIEPPRSLVSIKQSKDGVLKQVVPEVQKLKNKYDLAWDQKSPRGYLSIMAVLQKMMDQAISVNTTYNPKFYEHLLPEGERGKIPESVLLEDILYFYKYGGKNLYYHNSPDGAGEKEIETELQPLEEGEICDSCAI